MVINNILIFVGYSCHISFSINFEFSATSGRTHPNRTVWQRRGERRRVLSMEVNIFYKQTNSKNVFISASPTSLGSSLKSWWRKNWKQLNFFQFWNRQRHSRPGTGSDKERRIGKRSSGSSRLRPVYRLRRHPYFAKLHRQRRRIPTPRGPSSNPASNPPSHPEGPGMDRRPSRTRSAWSGVQRSTRALQQTNTAKEILTVSL